MICSQSVQCFCVPIGYHIPACNLCEITVCYWAPYPDHNLCDVLQLSYYLFSPLSPLTTFPHFLLFHIYAFLYFCTFGSHYIPLISGQVTQFLSTSSLIAEATNPYSSHILYSVVLILWFASIITPEDTHQQVVDSDNEIVPDSEAEELEDDLEENSQSNDSERPSRKHMKHNSTCHQLKPIQIWFYPGTWGDLLERAKQVFCLWLIKECHFPECDVNFLSAQHALGKVMEEFKAKDCEVGDGRCKSMCHNIFS